MFCSSSSSSTECRPELDLRWINGSLRQDFLLKAMAAHNTIALHQSHMRLRLPINDDSLRMQYLCSAMPRSEPLSQSLTHMPMFPPLYVFLCLRSPVGISALVDARWPFEPPASTGKQQLSALLLTLSHSSRTSPQFCGPAAQLRDPRDLMPEAEAFSREKSIRGDCRRCCCSFFKKLLMVAKQCRGVQYLY